MIGADMRKAFSTNGISVRTSYTFEEALSDSLRYFDDDALAANVWVNKYALKDSQGKLYESNPDQMHRRIAKELARIEKKYPGALSEREIYEVLQNFKYIIPQGGPMAGIGNEFQLTSLSNCFVIGNGADSYGGILKIDEEQTQLMKRRGGVGHDLSHIRPKGSPVLNSAKTSTGVTTFMEHYSNSTREVAQDGRRGALMMSLAIQHPDAEDFIDAKMEDNKITGANISLKLNDVFIKAALEDQKFVQKFPIEADAPDIVKYTDARKLWNKLVYNAWKSGEPGILFWDTIVRESIPDCYKDLGFGTVSTNPCGEIPLCPYDSCRLMAINLFSYVKDPFTSRSVFDFDLFVRHIGVAQRLMDDIVDLEIEKIDKILEKIDSDPEAEELKQTEKVLWNKIRHKCVEGRRVGIGITGEGDMLAAMMLTYASTPAIDFSVAVHKTLALNAYRASVALAKERGGFKIYDADREAQNPFINRLRDLDEEFYRDMVRYGRRNISLLTIAPTGTTSLMTRTSSGIEPVFKVSYKRRRKVNPDDGSSRISFTDDSGDSWEEYNVLHPKFVDWLQTANIEVETVKKMSEKDLECLILRSPYRDSTADCIDWVQKVKMQGAIQQWIDHSISVTVNIPHTAKIDLVGEIFKTAWESGCKGITVYRDGSRSGVLVSEDKGKIDGQFLENHSPKRPAKLEAELVRFLNDKDEWIAVVGLLDGKPYEIFTGRAEDMFTLPAEIVRGWVIKSKDASGKNRYDFQYTDKSGCAVTYQGLSDSFDQEYWNYAKLISGVLRHGMPLPFVLELISGLNLSSRHINSWRNGVQRALKKFIPDGTSAPREKCNACGDINGLIYKEGCLMCKSCGFSECG